jgi:hypothetical protein
MPVRIVCKTWSMWGTKLNNLRIVIEESNRDDGMNNAFLPGMLLSPLGDLSHTSILYYRTHRAKLNPHRIMKKY